jgi:hypothetical protein
MSGRIKVRECEENSRQLMQLVVCVPMVNKTDKGMVEPVQVDVGVEYGRTLTSIGTLAACISVSS